MSANLSTNTSTSISPTQRHSLKHAVLAGLRESLETPEPQTAAQWADENFYLSVESSYDYTVGEWTTQPYQLAILNMMGNDDIREVNFQKSARIGYTKMLHAVQGYFLHHKRRNIIMWSPSDDSRDELTKEHVEPMIRDVPALLQMFPWHDRKHPYNTLKYKRFSNSKQLHLKGGKAAKNYREKSCDVAMYDELSSFDEDIEKEGNATTLGDKRIAGAAFPKSIRGSTPKIAGTCQIEKAMGQSKELFSRYVPCPHCGHEQTLKFGGKNASFGFKWEDNDPQTAYYVCEKNACVIQNKDLRQMDEAGYWKSENGVTTVDGIDFYGEDGRKTAAPESVGVHLWAAYCPFTKWADIIREWLKTKGDKTQLKAFFNTTCGETWDEFTDQVAADALYLRREQYRAQLPKGVLALTAGVDVQDDRLEISVWGFGLDDRRWLIEHDVYEGDPGRPGVWKKLKAHLMRSYEHELGVKLRIMATGVDTGGHYTHQAYRFCHDNRRMRVYAVKGSNQRGAPLVGRPTEQKIRGGAEKVKLYPVGTDTAKDVIFSSLSEVDRTAAGFVHFPIGMQYVDKTYFEQLTSEKKKTVSRAGGPMRIYVQNGRNETLDCFVYAIAALEVLRPVWKALLAKIMGAATVEPEELQEPDGAEQAPTEKRPMKKRKKRRVVRKRRKSFAKNW